MKIALCQINTRVGDIRGNVEAVRKAAAKTREQGAELAIFPEQCLGGYPALDLWEDPEFIKANDVALRFLARESREMGLIVGFTAKNRSRAGKPIYNAAALLHRGRIAALRYKSLLPTYDVFDEARYFEPASSNAPISFGKLKLGLSICEDAWAVEKGGRRLYGKDPIAEQIKGGADVLINLSASPFQRGKTRSRMKLLAAQARRAKKPFFYCNLVGGNDEIVFDGNSVVLDARGRVVSKGRAFHEDVILAETRDKAVPLPEPLFPDETDEIAQALQLGIRDYARKCGLQKVFVGLSGGIDSALVCALAVSALGPSHVTGVSMPSAYSSEGSVKDAEDLAQALGVRLLKIPIQSVFESYLRTLSQSLGEKPADLAEQNLQARIRGNLLMALANHEGGLLLSTGNKSELSVGYCTLYGDMSGGLAVLADVPKKTVYDLARWFNREKTVIPQNSIDKPPSAELKPDQRDQDDLPPYDALDAILTAYIEEHLGPDQIARKGFDPNLVSWVLNRIDQSEYKRRQAPPSLKISAKAFGVGRRMPIARGSYRDFTGPRAGFPKDPRRT